MERNKSQLIKYKMVNYQEKGVDKNEDEVVEEVEEHEKGKGKRTRTREVSYSNTK